MFTLTPLAAALQGVGYGSLLTALQGLWAVTVIPDSLPIEAAGYMAAGLPTSPSTRRRARRGVWLSPSAPFVEPLASPAMLDQAEIWDEEALALACIA